MQRTQIKVTGIVQGVGFRPFVYRIAVSNQLTGHVYNHSSGVDIEVEGTAENLAQFQSELLSILPPLARIDTLQIKEIPANGDTTFRIIESSDTIAEAALISPDVATCDDCLRELFDPNDRRYLYPFINCTNCGPRFTIIEELPYDRSQTTMREFPLCDDCANEYRNPLDRRFHAEPVACPVCGPQLEFVTLDKGTDKSVCPADGSPINKTVSALEAGKIVAIKGLGGFHLSCDAINENAVQTLRVRKGRPSKPLAVMFRSIDVLRCYCEVSEAEEKELLSYRQPILLLRKRADISVCRPYPEGKLTESLAPGIDEIGAFLPYTPIHHLLFHETKLDCLVMTSGNRSEEPIVIDNDECIEKLSDIADAALVHNRKIWNRCDDSVGYFSGSRLIITRRSRGFAPLPVQLETEVAPTLAVGAMYCNTFALAEGKRAFLSQHIGDVDNQATIEFMQESIEKLQRWLGIIPEIIAHDLHPNLLTTRFAQEIGSGKKLVGVQHHHAHFAAALAANQLRQPAIGIVFDGTGYGLDRTIWGGEIFIGDTSRVERIGWLQPLLLPGGDSSIKKPYRTAIAYLHQLFENKYELPEKLLKYATDEEIGLVKSMVDRHFNTVQTTSIGRLFDAVSAMLGVCGVSTYEGQAAIELEQLAWRAVREGSTQEIPELPFIIAVNGNTLQMEARSFFEQLSELVNQKKVSLQNLAYAFHLALSEAVVQCCLVLREQTQLRDVVLCGGVWQNRLLTQLTGERLEQNGFRPIYPGIIPVNDGGIALGQVCVANALK
ncbi:MAG: carbamoyltransferase HypF [bacterium]|nr:carbamoyltransferase HypF [bacterium]